jgi:hypothetical protein
METIADFFVHLFAFTNPLWFYWPLCAVVAVTYKATKFDDPKKIVLGSLHFLASVTVGMFVLGVIMFLVSRYL